MKEKASIFIRKKWIFNNLCFSLSLEKCFSTRAFLKFFSQSNLSLTYICALIEFESSLSYDPWIYFDFGSYYSNLSYIDSFSRSIEFKFDLRLQIWVQFNQFAFTSHFSHSLVHKIQRYCHEEKKKNNVVSSVTCDATVLLVSPRGVKSQSHGLKYHYYARSRYYRGPAIDRPAAKRMRLSRLKITRDTRYPWTLF